MTEPKVARRPRLWAALREVMVIVAGVSVALGADAAYDRVQARDQRDALVSGMLDDLASDSVAMAGIAQALPVISAATHSLLTALSSNDPVDPIELGVSIRQSVYLPLGAKETATYRELTATGTLSLISDPAVRRLILEYYSSSALGLPQVLWEVPFSSTLLPYDAELRRNLGAHFVAIMGCNGVGEVLATCLEDVAPKIDLRRMRGDEDLIGALVGVMAWTSLLQTTVESEAAARIELVDALSR